MQRGLQGEAELVGLRPDRGTLAAPGARGWQL